MQYKVNKPLRDFEFWGGAKDRAQQEDENIIREQD